MPLPPALESILADLGDLVEEGSARCVFSRGVLALDRHMRDDQHVGGWEMHEAGEPMGPDHETWFVAEGPYWLLLTEAIRRRAGAPGVAAVEPLVAVPEGPTSTRRWGSTADAARELGFSRATVDRRIAALRAAGIEPDSLPGGPTQAGEGGKHRHLRWDLDRLAAFWTASEQALRGHDLEGDKQAKARRGSTRKRQKTKHEGPAGKRSLLARVSDGRSRGG